MTNAMVTTNGSDRAMARYQDREEVRELADRLLKMHPAAAEVGENAMRAAAQLALLLGANPLPGVNEMHIWRDKDGRNCMSLGINFWRRMAQDWGGVLYEVRPRLMRPDEAAEYGIAAGVTAAICKGIRASDMIKWHGLGFTANQVWDMCGRTGVGTSTANEYAKKGRPPSWTALKRAETDMLRQLFPAEFGRVDREMITTDASVVITPDGDVIEGNVTEDEPRQLYTLGDANRDLFGIQPERGNAPPAGITEDGEYEDTPPTPPAATNGKAQPAQDLGPLPDDELTIEEATAAQFIPKAAGLLKTDTDTLKARLKALGYGSIPGKPAERVAAYRKLRADMGHADDLMGDVAGQPTLIADDPDARQAALATAQGQLD
jgi:hypothetical protein